MTPSDEVAGPEVPECSADMVDFAVVTAEEVLGSSDPVEIVGTGVRSLAVSAHEGERCGVAAWPTLRLASVDGAVQVPVPPEGSPAPDARLLLEGRQRLVGFLRWDDGCALSRGGSVMAELVGGGTAVAPLNDPPVCDVATVRSGGVWMTYPEQAPASPLAVQLADVPATAPSGGTLRFTVEVHNPGTSPVSLDPCPILRAGFGESGIGVFLDNELNCDAAPGELSAGERVRQAVEMALPAEEIQSGFVGSLSVDVYTDADHQPAKTEWVELRAE